MGGRGAGTGRSSAGGGGYTPSESELRGMLSQNYGPTRASTINAANNLEKLPKGTSISYQSDNSWNDVVTTYTKTGSNTWEASTTVNGKPTSSRTVVTEAVASKLTTEIVGNGRAGDVAKLKYPAALKR